VTRKVAEAAALGDRSENAEYIYGKKQLRETDARIRFLSKRLDDLTVVDRLPPDTSRVFFGAWVGVVDAAGIHHEWRLVGPDEIDAGARHISIDSPLARALLGKRVGDSVNIVLGDADPLHFCLETIRYDSVATESRR
jgi:transcription elongation factor GreB